MPAGVPVLAAGLTAVAVVGPGPARGAAPDRGGGRLMLWLTILVACVLAYLAKLAVTSYRRPGSTIRWPRGSVPCCRSSLLAALVAVQTFTTTGRLVLDARAAGLAAAAVALMLRAPFLVVVIVGAAVAAGLRALT